MNAGVGMAGTSAGALEGGRLLAVGECARTIFGLTPAERLARQAQRLQGTLIADASAVLGDDTIAWLQANPGTLLTDSAGRPLALLVPADEAEAARRAFAAGGADLRRQSLAELSPQFSRKLRRRERAFAATLRETAPAGVERALFDSVYKGVTDLVTKYAWPVPAFFVTRLLARLGVKPNLVTFGGIALTFLAAWLFYEGRLGEGLAAAWAMTFLDTVDGKLARVTVTSSRFGDKLDHGNDYLHPPLWWICLAAGLAAEASAADRQMLWVSAAAILVAYVVGRAVEEGFKRRLGFNAYLWRPFDSAFRLVVSRRNTILLIMTAGLLLGDPVTAFIVSAAWSAVSVIIQMVRFAQASVAEKPIQSWLM